MTGRSIMDQMMMKTAPIGLQTAAGIDGRHFWLRDFASETEDGFLDRVRREAAELGISRVEVTAILAIGEPAMQTPSQLSK